MKKTYLFIVLFLTLASSITRAQIVESRRNAANSLWEAYGRNASNPSQMPSAVPLDPDSNIDQITISPTFNNLQTALNTLLNNNGGILKFNNSSSVSIKFNNVIHLIPLFRNRDKVRTIVIQGKNITFDGQDKTSLFLVRGNIRLVIQDAKLSNANFEGESQANIRSILRSGGGAIEIAQKGDFSASLRVRNCQFTNNGVSHFRGMGENQNGGAIRVNYKSTAEIFGCTFSNNKAVTGGAIGGTSIKKLIIIDSFFDSNLSNGYESTTGYMNVVEGAGALRVDRTLEPIEIYGTSFTRNSANVKASVMQVFIAPISGSSPGYPADKPALVIDNCEFKNNTYNNYVGVSNFRRVFFAGCVIFQGSRNATIKLTNSVFNNNEVGQANIRLINNFEFDNCIFANTKFLNIVDASQQGAVFLQKIPNSGSFDNCTFYKNEPRNGNIANDIMFWESTVPSRVTLNKSIFYRTNTSSIIKQVRVPLRGSGNNQYIPTVNMSLFAEVSNLVSNKTNPNISPNNIVDMCLGSNSLPVNIGGLPDCGTANPLPPTTGETFFVVNRETGKKLRTKSKVDGDNLELVPESWSGAPTKWQKVDAGNGYFYLKNVDNNMYFRPTNHDDGSILVQRPTTYNGTFTQWKEVNASVGYVYLQNRATGDYFRPETEDNYSTIVQKPTNYNGPFTQWKLVPVSSSSRKISTVEEEKENILVYPNPLKDGDLHLHVPADQTFDVSIFDQQGRLVYAVQKVNYNLKLNRNILPKSGLYIIQLISKRGVERKKLLVE